LPAERTPMIIVAVAAATTPQNSAVFFTDAPAWLLACGLASAIPAASAG